VGLSYIPESRSEFSRFSFVLVALLGFSSSLFSYFLWYETQSSIDFSDAMLVVLKSAEGNTDGELPVLIVSI